MLDMMIRWYDLLFAISTHHKIVFVFCTCLSYSKKLHQGHLIHHCLQISTELFLTQNQIILLQRERRITEWTMPQVFWKKSNRCLSFIIIRDTCYITLFSNRFISFIIRNTCHFTLKALFTSHWCLISVINPSLRIIIIQNIQFILYNSYISKHFYTRICIT